MASTSNNDFVVIEFKDPVCIEEAKPKETFISTKNISNWNLELILSSQIVKVEADRNRLIEESSYFRSLLTGSFSDSCLGCISVHWDLETAVDIVRVIHGCRLNFTASNLLSLLEGALFFGVDALLLECKTWFTEILCSKEQSVPYLPAIIEIWNCSSERAIGFMKELCAEYLARNFMWAVSCDLFVEVPYSLLSCCTVNRQLTVDSEKHLAEALLVWLDNNTGSRDCSSNLLTDYHTDILKTVRFRLLPLWFAAGNKRNHCFSSLAEESIGDIFSLIKNPSTSVLHFLRDGDNDNIRIRLTDTTERVDLSGCPQMTFALLLLSILPSSFNTDPTSRKRVEESLVELEHLNWKRDAISQNLFPTSSFGAVREVDISKCPQLNLEAAIYCFSKSFPSLRTLRASYCLHFKMETLLSLVENCPLVHEVDLTADITPVLPIHESTISRRSAEYHNEGVLPYRLLNGRSLSSSIAKLTLEGRSDISGLVDLMLLDEGFIITKCLESLPIESAIEESFSMKNCEVSTYLMVYDGAHGSETTNSESRSIILIHVGNGAPVPLVYGVMCTKDSDLDCVSLFSGSISYLNIKGCTSVTDVGISKLICKCVNLQALDVSDTYFGRNSILALCSYTRRPNSLASGLLKVHMGGCKDVDVICLSQLLSDTYLLKSLCLRGTVLNDHALYNFSGFSLEMLDVSDTMVSGAALAHIIGKNHGLKRIKSRSCRNLVHLESNLEDNAFHNGCFKTEELYAEIGRKCTLEDVSFGWGFSSASLEQLGSSIRSLRTITVGLGASLSEKALISLPVVCPLLESVLLSFQVISDSIVKSIIESSKHLQVLGLCYCLGDLSSLSFRMPSLRKLRLERVVPSMTNDDLVILTQECTSLVELSLLGCPRLNTDSQQIISRGWPGLISVHLEDCGELTSNGVSYLFDCRAIEDLLLRHNGCGIEKNFIVNAASRMPMLRKVALDLCDAGEGGFNTPSHAVGSLSIVKMAKCKKHEWSFNLPTLEAGKKLVHKKTTVLEWNAKGLRTTVVTERV